jgi:predicted ABC-type transport system involved in lysophospholipase L1 biosynthesis ATPase subunit
VIEFIRVVKTYNALRPLRIADLMIARGDALALGGFDAGAAEMFVNLVTGAAVPDSGEVLVAGRSTRDIATDTEWLASLDRFGIITERAVLLESLSVEANLALPFTLAIEPVADAVRARVGTLAAEVGLDPARLRAPVASLSAEERMRAHLARALGPAPEILLFEHPTARLDAEAARAIGATVRQVASAHGLGWVALTEDERFARTAGARRLRLEPSTGRLTADGFWRRIFSHE